MAAIFGYGQDCDWDRPGYVNPVMSVRFEHAAEWSIGTFIVLSILLVALALVWHAFLGCIRGVSDAVRGKPLHGVTRARRKRRSRPAIRPAAYKKTLKSSRRGKMHAAKTRRYQTSKYREWC